MYGAPVAVEGFRVTKYIELDAPDNAPIEAYPPGEADDPNMAAVISYIDANYSEGRHYTVYHDSTA
jgi:hypothetical protein